ncbi:Coadhesin [Holothuria leucospilota]|uniref:Coadhesin n=1 Tax=Holothuria leucospilota TaxID=206669 RepID=A0A9Q1C101_HOLLE|nr:Coadhesin [Holothuria leucospilota]
MDYRNIFFLSILLGSTWTVIQSSSPTASITDQLLLLKPEERDRFAKRCFRESVCSREDLDSFVWMSQHAKLKGQDRFWYSYQCALSKKQADCPVDGGWSNWGQWGECVSGCGTSLTKRYRNCTNPAPRRGGFVCDGQASQVTNCESLTACKVEGLNVTDVLSRARKVLETFHKREPELGMMCATSRCSYQQVDDVVTPNSLAEQYWSNLQCVKYLHGCPVDGGWEEWSPWSECSSRCGEGRAFRRRRCNQPEPGNGGASCEGPPLEEGQCFNFSCTNTVGVMLSPWSSWTECPVTCGEGLVFSTRRCVGAATCDILKGQRVERMTRTASCVHDVCDRKGGWSEWSDWTECTALCGNGTRYRLRACDNPTPIGEGNECEGEGHENEACRHWENFCDPNKNQEYSEWDEWSHCSRTCKGGFQIRGRTCLGELDCNGAFHDRKACNLEKLCPVDGGWSEWSQWSVCSQTCGEGTSDRHRVCNKPYPQFGGLPCEGKSQQIQDCNRLDCPANITYWGDWNSWSVCSDECGGGTQQRTRECFLGTEKRSLAECGGEFEQTSVCNFQQCSVDGNWAGWSEWTTCSATCGDGRKTRDRTCTDPAPEGQGTPCEGLGTDVLHCSLTPCQPHRSYVYTFDSSAFIAYRRLARPTKHCLLFVRFYPTGNDGLLVLKRDEDINDVFIIVRLIGGRIDLHARAGSAHAKVQLGGVQATKLKYFILFQLSKWNEVEIGLSGNKAWLRINDGIINSTDFTSALPHYLDWDMPLHLAGALPHLLPQDSSYPVPGFHGKISEFRMNYQELRLTSEIDQWKGAGVPYVTLNVGEELAEVDSQLTQFGGGSYITIPVEITSDTHVRPLVVELIVKLEGDNGLLLYNVGEEPGSHLAVFIRDYVPILAIDFGNDLLETNCESIPLHTWVTLDILVDGPYAEIRVNKGPAGQVSSPYQDTYYKPRRSMSVGGASPADMAVVTLAVGVTKGFEGYIFTSTVNGDKFLSSENVIRNPNKTVNSASATVSGHYQEVREPEGSSIILRCIYHNLIQSGAWKPAENQRWLPVRWLKGDQILDIGDHIKLENRDPIIPFTSSLHLRNLDENFEGLYACQVHHNGRGIITQAFGVSVFNGEYYDFDPDIVGDVMIVVSVCLLAIIVVGTVIFSFIPSLRKRFTLLQNVHKITNFCLGIPRRIVKKKDVPQTTRRKLLDEINATYDNFVARVEKAKENATKGTLNSSLLDEINATYDDFLERVVRARNMSNIDEEHLKEINATYEKFLQRMNRDKKKDVLKEINETYENFLERSQRDSNRPRVDKGLLEEVSATYENFKEREEKAKKKTALMSEIKDTHPSARKEREGLKKKLLGDIDKTYEDFKAREEKETKRAALMKAVKETKGRFQKPKRVKQQIGALIEDVNKMYDSFKEREKKALKKKWLMNEIKSKKQGDSEETERPPKALLEDVRQTYDNFKDREIKQTRKAALMEQIKTAAGESSEKEGGKRVKKELLAEITGLYDEVKEKSEMAKRRNTLMQEIKDTGKEVEKDRNQREKISTKKASVMKDVAALYDSMKDREKRLVLRKMLMREIEENYDGSLSYEEQGMGMATKDSVETLRQRSSMMASTSGPRAEGVTKKSVSFLSPDHSPMMTAADAREGLEDDEEGFSEFTSEDEDNDLDNDDLHETMTDLLSKSDEDQEENNEQLEANTNFSNARNITTATHDSSHSEGSNTALLEERRPSVKELAKRLSASLTLLPDKQRSSPLSRSNFSGLSSVSASAMSKIASETNQSSHTAHADTRSTSDGMNGPIIDPQVMQKVDLETHIDEEKVSSLTRISTPAASIPPPPPPPPEGFGIRQTFSVSQYEDQDNSHLTPFISSSTELEEVETDGTIASNNNNETYETQNQSVTNLFTRRGTEGGATSLLYDVIVREYSPIAEGQSEREEPLPRSLQDG